MPNKLDVSKETLAKRHVLSQQIYRRRKTYRLLVRSGLTNRAALEREAIINMERKYESIGGRPHHRGNVL